MANSIANLAVVISGHTKPLEDSMKKAQSKVSSFGHSFKEGAMLGAGVMGLDKLEQAMKKAIADVPELAEAADEAEKSFGRILLKVTGIGAVLPTIAGYLKQAADYFNSNDTQSGFGYDVQVFKEQAASLFMSSETRAKELQTMREQWETQTKINNAQAEYAKFQKEQAEAEKKKEELVKSNLESYSKQLSSELDALDPMREKLRIADDLAKSNDVFLKAEIGIRELRKQELVDLAKKRDILKGILETALKMRGEGAEVTKQQMTNLEKAEAEKTRLTKLLLMGGLDMESYNRAMQQQEDIIMATSELPDFDEEAKPDKGNELKLSGAATAGSEAAYSIIANAQAEKQSAEIKTQTVELKKQTTVLQKIEEKTPQPGDFAFGVFRMELK